MSITICEVGPRDGLQSLARHVEVADRIALIDQLTATGLGRIEAVSFVSEAKVPRMAGAEQVLAGIDRRPGVEIAALVLNRRGAERALGCALDEVRVVVVAGETLSHRNQGAGIADTLAGFAAMATEIRSAGRRLVGIIAAAFGCPYEGRVGHDQVVAIAEELLARGAEEIILADTIGAAVPSEAEALTARCVALAGSRPVGGHFHNTRNLGFANAYAALRAGATVLDASIGGLGGCPFAPRATGNIATEDLAYMLRGMGLGPAIDLAGLIATTEWLENHLGMPLPGLLAKAGLFPEAAEIAADRPTAAAHPR